jgi:hypothetical protein
MPVAGYAFDMGCGPRDHEINTLALHANGLKLPRQFFRNAKEIPKGWMPVGTVDFVESVLGRSFKPDYLPQFLSEWVHRKTWFADKWPYGHRVFIKPSDRHKRFTGFTTKGNWKGRKKGPFLCSEIVSFTNEWRYYVANGRLLTARWYWGDDVNTPPAPELAIKWPDGFCGAVDFGTLADGRIALIEANHPYSCGWYGKLGEGAIYSEWLEAGWEYVNKLVA